MIAFVSIAQVILGERNPTPHNAVMTSHEKLSLLLQPALIRLIDQLRTQLKEVNWTWTYETIEIWPKEVPQITRSQYEEMVRALEVASGEEAETIQDGLDSLPQPVPLYRLDITYQETVLAINMWQLCYQICLQDYEPQLKDMSIQSPDLDGAKLDHALIDHDGEIAWEPLNQKAQLVVSQLIESISREGCQ